MHHIMLDIETLGTAPGSIIASIAAVVFGPEGTGRMFYQRVKLESCAALGLTVDADTVLWWMQKDGAGRHELTTPKERAPIIDALRGLAAFIADAARSSGPNLQIWGNGPDFDCALLESAYRRAGLPCPWRPWDQRCLRTLRSIAPHIPKTTPQIPHHALHDSIAQAQHAGQILDWLESTRTTAVP